MSSISIKGAFKKRKREILSKFHQEDILEISFQPNFYGVASKKSRQVRGNGILILTREKLFFEMYYPRKEVSIELRSITDIETPKGFLNKTRFRPLLKITFINDEGKTDAAAWELRNLDNWITRIVQIKSL